MKSNRSSNPTSLYGGRRFPFKTIFSVIRQLAWLALAVAVIWFIGNEVWQYLKVRDNFPQGTQIGQIEVGALGFDDAKTKVIAQYAKPIIAMHNQQAVEIFPADAGFMLSIDPMLDQAISQLQETPIGSVFSTTFQTNIYMKMFSRKWVRSTSLFKQQSTKQRLIWQ